MRGLSVNDSKSDVGSINFTGFADKLLDERHEFMKTGDFSELMHNKSKYQID